MTEILNALNDIYGQIIESERKISNLMSENYTIGELTNKVEQASTDFEKRNTELKRKYLVYSIEVFNMLAQKVSVSKGSFGTGYPFYALDNKLEGKLPIISEQIRYNRQLTKDGQPYQKSIWKCKECLDKYYASMPDLKSICKPCPNVPNVLKPRKLINRIPDLDMWIICKDGYIEVAQQELEKLLDECEIKTSDVSPISTINDIYNISKALKEGNIPEIFLPIDTHIIEYSKIKALIEAVPEELKKAKQNGEQPYLPIHPKSYRKTWQYDDEAYNYVYDYLSAFTEFNFTEELQQILNSSRSEIASSFTTEELFGFLLKSATPPNFRRFQSPELEEIFQEKVLRWQGQNNLVPKKEYEENEL